jgi:hypothetical protein
MWSFLTLLIPAIAGAAVTVVLALPTRIANWSIRRQGLEVDLERIEHDLAEAKDGFEREFRGARRSILGRGTTHVTIGDSDEEYALGQAEKRRDREVNRVGQEARLRRLEITKELDASWWTHMFAERCQGGHQPSGLRPTFPRRVTESGHERDGGRREDERAGAAS